MAKELFLIKEIVKSYAMGDITVQALKGVSLSLYESELCVLLGPSGSGKSTLLNIIGGLDVPTSGEVFYKNQDLSQMNPFGISNYRRENIGFVFQYYNLIPSLTALENVQIVTEIANDPMVPIEALELVDMAHRKNHFPAQLSGGEQQRVAIARAIAKKPNVMLCDEPTGALDLKTGIKVLEALNFINRELGTLTVVITHNADIAKMATRILRLGDGKILSSMVNENPIKASELSW